MGKNDGEEASKKKLDVREGLLHTVSGCRARSEENTEGPATPVPVCTGTPAPPWRGTTRKMKTFNALN